MVCGVVILQAVALVLLVLGRIRRNQSKTHGIMLMGAGCVFLAISLPLCLFRPDTTGAKRAMSEAATRSKTRGRVMGAYVARQHPGASVVVLVPPSGYPGPKHSQDMADGFLEGCGNDIHVMEVIPLNVSAAVASAGEQAPDRPPPSLSQWISLEEIDRAVAGVDDRVDLVVLALRHPHSLFRSTWIRNPDAPPAALLHYNLSGLKPTIGSGRVVAAVGLAPDPSDFQPELSGVRGAARKEFAEDYLLVTPDNVETLSAKHPGIFF